MSNISNIILNYPKSLDDLLNAKDGIYHILNKNEKLIFDIVCNPSEITDSIENIVSFKGDFILKIGVKKPGVSYRFIYEKHFKSSTQKTEEFSFKKSPIKDVIYECKIYPIENTYFFYETKTLKEKQTYTEYKNRLYALVKPKIGVCTDEELFYLISQKNNSKESFYSFDDDCLFLYKDTIIDFTTYFNLFSSEKWSELTNIKTIGLELDFKGECKVAIYNYQEGLDRKLLSFWSISLKERKNVVIEDIPVCNKGIIGFELYITNDSVLYNTSYLTKQEKTNSVKLGIGITTFKREEACKEAVNRLAKEINESEFSKQIAITVVDNGNTLSKSDFESSVNLVPNKNYGGTGGFMRNLLEYQQKEDITHCLFMDDDASCGTESIYRSIKLIEYSKYDNLAISGSMFSENNRFMQWENGAYFDRTAHALNSQLDLRIKSNVIKNEKIHKEHKIYGAWWFFMFPLNYVKRYCFPFFVRGDDIEFSYINDFKIFTLNGVSTWQEDFKLKESPLTIYLDARSTLIQHMLLPDLKQSRKDSIKYLKRMFFVFNNSYQYDSAHSVLLAIGNVLKGPDFWKKNLDIAQIRKKINGYTSCEIKKKGNILKYPFADKNIRFKFFTKQIRLLTLWGHLLPTFMLDKNVYHIDKYMVPNPNRIGFRKEIIVNDYKNNYHIHLKRNSLYYFKNLLFFMLNMINIYFKYNQIKKKYNAFFEKDCNKEFWKKILEK